MNYYSKMTGLILIKNKIKILCCLFTKSNTMYTICMLCSYFYREALDKPPLISNLTLKSTIGITG